MTLNKVFVMNAMAGAAEYQGATYYVCASGYPAEQSQRCAWEEMGGSETVESDSELRRIARVKKNKPAPFLELISWSSRLASLIGLFR